MKSIYSKLVLISLLLVTASTTVSARECVECKKTNSLRVTVQSKAAVCKRAQSTAELNINNVRALINGYGNMWYDGSVAKYHLPKNSNTCPLFCAALWIGGTDVNDQLRIAALKFGSDGDDYWPGPLKINGTASVDLPVCNQYDKHWIITKAEVLAHKAHFEYDSTGAQVIDNYSAGDIPDIIRDWPAHGNGDDLTSFLAPFFDANHNGVYEPEQGDYPYYDFNNDLCPRTLKAEWGNKYTEHVLPTQEDVAGIVTGGLLSDQVLKGDQTIWWVFNDKGNTHTETKGEAIGLEIRAQAFAFSTNDEINNMTFYSYEIINRSTYELRETYFSQWVDPDLGYAWDDFVGCDVRRGLGYCYNGKSQDSPGSGSYSGLPPAVGIDFFQGPYMDPDGLDNPKIDIPKILSDSYTNLSVKSLLQNYRRVDEQGRVYYDTISITDDADIFFALDPSSWYFVPGDAVGNCAINGVNFGNNIVDDERFGMRRFVYYDNSLDGTHGEPQKASDYYNYLRGYWKNGQRMKFGGNGASSGVVDLACDFMFPDNSDPWNWGTDGADPHAAGYTNEYWNEISSGNDPRDVRFMQSAGPFTLRPGALNYITVGIPFAQASSGEGQWASVTLLREIDDVCQALFENCFKVLDGPDAPTMTAQELSNEIILYLNYEDKSSNNYNEKYREVDPAIVRSYTDNDGVTHLYDSVARSYIFEGYQIYQLKDANTSIADISDATKARLIYQCDIENYYDTILSIDSIWRIVSGDTVFDHIDTTWNPNPSLPIGTLVNYTTNTQTGLLTGTVMVNGANKGIQHVFRVTTDAFATGSSNALVNNREYYFIAIAYAQNRFKEYSQTEAAFLDGQKEPYLAGRKNERGGSITPITVIPHNPAVEDGGKLPQAEFGMCPNIIRIEGYGNGTSSGLRLTEQSITELMGAPGVEGKGPGTYVRNITTGIGAQGDRSYMTNPCIIAHPQYEENYGPVNVRVIDPLKLKEGRFNILFWNPVYDSEGNITDENNDANGVNKHTRWCIVNADPTKPVYVDSSQNGVDSVFKVWSHFSISRYNEQIFPELGIAVSLLNPQPAASSIDLSGYRTNYYPGKFYQGFAKEGALLGSSMTFSNENKQWLYGLPDNDSYLIYNWIRSGSQFSPNAYKNFTSPTSQFSVDEAYLDEDYFKAFKRYPDATTSSIDSSEGIDKTQIYEGVVGGTWAPYGVVSTMPFHPGFSFTSFITEDDQMLDSLGVNRYQLERLLMTNIYNAALNYNELSKLPSVRIVITADQSKWTRCPVVEMCDDYSLSEGNARRFALRRHASVNKDGLTAAECAEQGITYAAGSTDDPEYISADGMSWFPGYAINTVSGERLNIMFGEDSRFVQYNGRDMMWNPVSSTMEGTQNYVMGGRHFIYVMNATRQTFYNLQDAENVNLNKYVTYVTPSYDAGRWAMNMLRSAERMLESPLYPTLGTPRLYKGLVSRADNYVSVRDSIAMLYASTAWVNIPLVSSRYEFTNPKDIPCDVTINIDIRTPYNKFMGFNGTDVSRTGNTAINKNMPVYQFVINASDAVLENLATASNARQSYVDSILSLINVVPNPYYSYSNYETASQLETKVRFINLPTGINKNGKKEGCYIRIYTSDGTLVRTLGPTPVNSTTYDWDLHNQTGIPIAGGMYLIHVSVPGIGERVIKWFGTMRPVDLNSFGF
ncbi:MAG: hypothetical protein IK058_04180 [Bacteroidales bacterium]|nr:hypothetical protein [Bacteroidales bacterium]